MIDIAIIAAVADNGVIGREGEMPWTHSEDLAHFKETTMGHPVIMGRITYEAIVDRLGQPLPGRTNIVLTRSELELPESVARATSIDAAIEIAATHDEICYIIGGASVYRATLSIADQLILTELHESYDGDAYFPEIDQDNWTERTRDAHEKFDIVIYDRRT